MSFPANDRRWAQALDFARDNIGPGEPVFAHDHLLQFFPEARPYIFITRRGLAKCDWIILHKDYVPRLGLVVMRQVKKHFEAAWANELFVIFRNRKSRARQKTAGEFDPAHVRAMWEAVEKLERNPAEPDYILSQLRQTYAPPGALGRAVKKLGDRFLSPKTLVINVQNGSGFLSNLKLVMSHLVHSLDRDGIRSVRVEWLAPGPGVANNFPYGRPEDGNLWDYFFEPVAQPSKSSWKTIHTCAQADPFLSSMYAHYAYKSAGEWRRLYHAAFQKYVRVRPHILKKVDEFHAKNMAGRPVVGVHVRNAGHKVEYITGEAMGFEGYAEKVREAIAARGEDSVIFLATDVEEAVEKFRETFGTRVLVQPGVARLLETQTGDNNQQLHHRNPNPSVKFGEDVLIDCLLLSKCDVLIHTVSNIATAVGYFNPGIEMVYCE